MKKTILDLKLDALEDSFDERGCSYNESYLYEVIKELCNNVVELESKLVKLEKKVK